MSQFIASKNLLKNLTPDFKAGCNFSYNAICTPSSFDFVAVNSPFRLLFITSAISPAAPLDFLNSSSNFAASSIPALSIKLRPLIESEVNVADNADAFSASPIPFVAFSTSSKISVKSR